MKDPIELPDAGQMYEQMEQSRPNPAGHKRRRKICARRGHDWGERGPICLRCGKLHHKRGKIQL